MLNTRVTQFIVWLLICLISVPPNALATVKTCDFAGRLTRVEQRDAADTVVWAENHLYNERGRLRKKETTAGILTYAYDAADRLESITTSRGTATAYAYDAGNRLATATDQDNGATEYSYNASGSLDTVTLPNGVATEYTYNAVNRLTAIVTQKGANTLATFAYTLRDSGHRSQLQETINGAARTTDWTYDILYRLTGETVNNTATVSYTYDKVGNRQSRTGSGAGGTGVPPVGLYAYDLNDRLLSADTRNYTYDANGNTLTGHAHTAGINHLTGLSLTAQTVTDTYDHANRLIKRTAPGQTITILYDADGNRVAKTINGATTYYLVDTSNPTGYAQVIEEIKDGVVQKRYNYGLDLISQQHRQTNGTYLTRYFGYDGLGSVRYLTDDAGGITDRYIYDGYGTLLDKWSSGTSTDNVYLYAGEQYDPDLGLYYNRARYLNTDTGRFWSMDSFEGNNATPLSLHKYLYVHGNPINGIDPSGHFGLFGAYSTYTSMIGNIVLRTLEFAQGLAANRNYSYLIAAAATGLVVDFIFELTPVGSFLKKIASGLKLAQTAVRKGVLKQIGHNAWESTAGLRYIGLDADGLNRIEHILLHTISMPNKPKHSMFITPPSEILSLLDEAWSARKGYVVHQQSGNWNYRINVGRVIGANGESAINISVRPGTSEVVTAFPIL